MTHELTRREYKIPLWILLGRETCVNYIVWCFCLMSYKTMSLWESGCS